MSTLTLKRDNPQPARPPSGNRLKQALLRFSAALCQIPFAEPCGICRARLELTNEQVMAIADDLYQVIRYWNCQHCGDRTFKRSIYLTTLSLY